MREKKQATPARQALIVLGMHRSGTSALGGVLTKLGAQAPKSLMPPTPDNPRGYWESTEIMKFHDSVLESAGTCWNDWDRFNEYWVESPTAIEFMDRLPSLIEDEYGKAGLFLVKDPRMCRLLPAWLQVLGAAGITLKIVVPIRHPLEVANSLATRDHITRLRSQLIWLRHILDAESSSRGLTRTFIRYSDLLIDWRSQVRKISAELDIKWPRWSSAVESEIETYLSSGLRHHAAPEDALPQSSAIGRWVGRAYCALEALCDGGEQVDACRELDEVRREFDSTSATYAPVLHEVQCALEQKIEASTREVADAVQELGDLTSRFELLKQENLANYQLAMTHKGALDDLREQYQNRENAHASLETRCEAMQAGVDRQLQVNEELRVAHRAEIAGMAARMQQQIKELKDAKRLAEESVQERFQETAKLSSRLLELEERVQAREASIRESDKRLKEQQLAQEASIREADKRLKEQQLAQEASIREADKRLKEQRLAWDAARAESSALRGVLEDHESAIRAMRRELEIQAQMVSEYRSKLEDARSGTCWKLANALRRRLRKQPEAILGKPKTDGQLLRESKLFDPIWYLNRYPDVRSRGMDPIRHYLRYGADEGRDPGPAFSTAGYRTRHPDVATAGINPLIHYLRHGREEGRSFLALESKAANGADERTKKD